MWTLMILALACTDPPVPAPAQIAPSSPAAPAASADTPPPADWGAVFWRDGKAWRVGAGDVLVGPDGAGLATPDATTKSMPCQGTGMTGGPSRAVLALPIGTPVPQMATAPAIPAHVVERAAWRLDEVLPPADRFTPNMESPDPARQRGVTVGSVVKTRRHGAPPILLSAGIRGGSGAVSVLDAKAAKTLATVVIKDVKTPLRVLPALDLDGDGAREFAAYSETVVALFRLVDETGSVSLVSMGVWRCD